MKRILVTSIAATSLIVFGFTWAWDNPVGGCPDHFELVDANSVGGDIGSKEDKNGDDAVCMKVVPEGRGKAAPKILVIDNNANVHADKNN